MNVAIYLAGEPLDTMQGDVTVKATSEASLVQTQPHGTLAASGEGLSEENET